MTKKYLYKFSVAFLCLYSCQNPPENTQILTEGISSELAVFRHGQLSDIHYGLTFHIPENKEDSIPARLVLEVNLAETGQPLYLDFREQASFLHSLEVNGKMTGIDLRQEHLIIPAQVLQKGKNHIRVDFRAGEQSLNRNEDYLYTLLVPDRARTLFPCFDQPDLKAVYQLTLTAPKNWKVLAGGADTAQSAQGDLITHHFAQTKRIPTYLFSFVAGKFDTASADTDRFPMQLLYRETNAEKISQSVPAIFGLHRQAIQFLETYTDSPFPFPKLGYAAIPNFQYGGMEHVGAIQYQEATLFLDNTATESQQLARAKLIAHETSHMWFGDKVTMKWFNDVWMKEVFANFMADKIVNPAFPDVNHDLLFVMNHYPSAYSEDRSQGSNPIRQHLDNLNNAGSLYGNIIYDKAPIMMRQLELTVGKEPFRQGIQAYLKKYAYGNATWNDLMAILDAQTPVDLKSWSEVWVNQPSRPLISDDIRYENNRISAFDIQQKAEDGSERLWPQQFSIGLVYPDSVHRMTVKLDGANLHLTKAIGLPKPVSVIYNYDGLGYGVFPMGETDLKTLPDIPDDVARGSGYINSFECLLNGNIAPILALKAYQKGLQLEKNELIIRQVSTYASTVFWNFLSQGQRDSIRPLLATQLYQTLQTNVPPNLKKPLFGLFSELAYTGPERERLYLIWKKQAPIAGLKLNEDDYTAMAMQLAIYRHPQAAQILKDAQAALSNPDKQRRFAFLLPSLSDDTAVRDRFFNGLEQEKNREQEAWVLAALNNIFHPLRRDDATKHLQQALDWLGDIQKTGDIFFPKAWLNATAGKYNSKAAYNTVNQFLKAHPDYNPALRNKILQATDYLYRGQRLHLLQ